MAKKNVVGPKGARLLRRVAKHILADPLRYEQDYMIEHGAPGELLEDGLIVPKCGTIACIGGWLAILNAKNPKRVKTFNVRTLATVLGVTRKQVFRLIAFTWTSTNGWPARFSNRYKEAGTAKQKAKVAVQRIEHFIRTGA
jgi:hypothetical protein